MRPIGVSVGLALLATCRGAPTLVAEPILPYCWRSDRTALAMAPTVAELEARVKAYGFVDLQRSRDRDAIVLQGSTPRGDEQPAGTEYRVRLVVSPMQDSTRYQVQAWFVTSLGVATTVMDSSAAKSGSLRICGITVPNSC